MTKHLRKAKQRFTETPFFEIISKVSTEALLYVVFAALFGMTIEHYLAPSKPKQSNTGVRRISATACSCPDEMAEE